jgi:hypothetical protein
MPRSAGSKLYLRRQAQGARVRSHLRGSKSFRRTLKALPEETRVEMAHVLEDVGPKLARIIQANTPARTGALRSGIKWKVLRRSLRLQVGLLGTKRGRAALFYGYILNFGRKAQTVNVKRRTPSGAVASYLMRVRAYKALHFVTGRYADLRNMTSARLKNLWDRALARASRGAGND